MTEPSKSLPVHDETGRTETVSAGDLSDREALVESDLLVEEISIDGMCGVY
jgi:mycofactocin precursor